MRSWHCCSNVRVLYLTLLAGRVTFYLTKGRMFVVCSKTYDVFESFNFSFF